MSGRDRCDEIIRLIDEVLGDRAPAAVAAPLDARCAPVPSPVATTFVTFGLDDDTGDLGRAVRVDEPEASSVDDTGEPRGRVGPSGLLALRQLVARGDARQPPQPERRRTVGLRSPKPVLLSPIDWDEAPTWSRRPCR